MPTERLQKIIAKAGVASRREAESMIREGRVTINGRVVDELGTKADPARDHVKVDGKLITRAEEKRYILLYKPREVMTTLDDPEGRRTVIDFLRGVKERVFPVGRLDFHSEGLILLTNDGDLAFKVAHPSQGSVKTYNVKVRGVPEERILEKLRRGITIEGRRTLPCEIERVKTTAAEETGNSWFEVRLREGRTQQIRKMFKAVGHPVSKLRRVGIGPLFDNSLGPGDWRELTPREVRLLATKDAPLAPKRPQRKPPSPRSKKALTAAASKRQGGTARKGAKAAPAPGAARRRTTRQKNG